MDRRKIGNEPPEYPGTCSYPIYEYRCPDCKCWTQNICGIDGKNEQGEWTPLCSTCGLEVDSDFNEQNEPVEPDCDLTAMSHAEVGTYLNVAPVEW